MSVCRDGCTWGEVKRALEVREGRSIDDKTVTMLLKNLVDASFLVKEGDFYKPTDPLIRRAFQ